MKQIREMEKELPITYEPDVAVVGGGVAGIAAALAAARNGAKVLLIEKQCMLGGLATAGLVTVYLPLCDGLGRQLSYGICEELLRLSIQLGAQGEEPTAWLEHGTKEEKLKRRYEVQFNPHYFAILAEQLLIKEGVSILYDTKVCGVQCEKQDDGRNDGAQYEESDKRESGMPRRRISALMIENKSGRQAVQAKTYVDATGDADLFWYADAPTRLFGKGNLLAGWYYYFDGRQVKLRPLGECENFASADAKTRTLVPRRFSGIDGQELSEQVILSHEASLNDMLRLRKENPEMEPITIASMPQLRMTRCPIGEYELKESENDVDFPDSIGMIADWRKRGMVYEIPYRALYSRNLTNVISAGRCISVDDGMWDITRVIPPCAVTGEAAGTAAALAVKEASVTAAALAASGDFAAVPYNILAERLRANGQRLKFAEAEDCRRA